LPPESHGFASNLLQVCILLTLAWGVPSAMAQRTSIEKNGLAGTIETDYNAAGKATEMRTLGTDGKLQQKVQYENLPEHYVPDQTDTTYWPNGQRRKVAHKTYDESANFTGEFIQTFDEAGKQIAGHKLTHDPWKGTYRCSEWKIAAQDYRAVECPSGEEESGGNSAPKNFTYEEVMRQLEAARKNAKISLGVVPSTPAPSTPAPGREVGIVLPAHVHAGERISGIVVENPEHYADMPEVTVTRVAVRLASGGEGSRLSGWWVDAPGEDARRADGPITFVVPQSGLEAKLTFREAGNSARTVSQTLNFALNSASPRLTRDSAKNSHPQATFQSPALCMKHELCAVSGSFSGDSGKTFAAFEDRPATIVAETPDVAYVSIPDLTGPGSHPLFMAERSTMVALPVVVGDFFMRDNGREVQAGESLITSPTLDGPGDISDPAWQGGYFPVGNIDRARQLIPEFELTGDLCGSREKQRVEEERDREKKREKEPEKESDEKKEDSSEEQGRILIVIKNLAPEETSFHRSRNGEIVFCLSDEAFHRGAFKYSLRLDARKAGKVDAKGYVIPFLGAVAGQEFNAKSPQ
jgi:hypothetical protein